MQPYRALRNFSRLVLEPDGALRKPSSNSLGTRWTPTEFYSALFGPLVEPYGALRDSVLVGARWSPTLEIDPYGALRNLIRLFL